MKIRLVVFAIIATIALLPFTAVAQRTSNAAPKMGDPVAPGDIVETGINGLKYTGEITASYGALADIDLGQNNLGRYMKVEYMLIVQRAGIGKTTFGVGDIVKAIQLQNLAGTVYIQGKILRVNGGYCKIDSSGSGFTGWTRCAELVLIKKGPPQAVLSVVSGFPSKPGVENPIGDHVVTLLKESFEKGLMEVGVQSTSGKSPIEVWARACQNQTPDCQKGPLVLGALALGRVKADASGKATFPGKQAGIYYVFASARYDTGYLVWNVKVELKPGANSLTLDQGNAVPVN
jgi:hypothetical protein